jgi:hypothetical protein
MSTFHTALFDHLSTDAGVSALVGTRVYPTKAPQDAPLPCIIYQRFSDAAEHTQAGACDLASAFYQVDIIGENASSAAAVAEAVRNAMDGMRNVTAGGFYIRSAHLTSEDDSSILFQGSENERYLVSQDWDFWYFRSVPTL